MDKENLIKIDKSSFCLLRKGDEVYCSFWIDDFDKYKVISAKWLYSGENVISSKTLKPFRYYQVSVKNDVTYQNERYYDSISRQYEIRPIYVTKELFDVLMQRKKTKYGKVRKIKD